MQLTRWTYVAREGFTLRGWHSPPSGKPLLHFIHGNGFCGLTYEPLLGQLTDDFDLWISDAQGHGDSDHGGRFVGWNRSAELAMEALQTHRSLFGDVPQFAMGHSFGGVLSCLALASHPQQFQRAVLLDPVLFSPQMLWALTMAQWIGMSGHHELARKARLRRQHWPDRPSAIESLRGRGAYKGWSPESLQAFAEHALRPAADGGVELKCAPQREADIFSSAPEKLWSALNEVQTPTQVIHAQDGLPFVASSVRQWQAINPHIDAVETMGGHCFMQEDPVKTAQLVRQFLIERV